MSEHSCTYCGEKIDRQISVRIHERNKNFFCCKEHYWKWHKGKTFQGFLPGGIITCKNCHKRFEVHKYHEFKKRKFCSRSCQISYYSKGEKNCNWKGGISSEYDEIKQTQEYKEWRASVYRRDQWTCVQCSYKGKKIVAHHIKEFSDFPELRFDVDNGVTLCRSCHALIHTLEKNPQRLHVGRSNKSDDIVRTLWRHKEMGGNDPSTIH